MLGTIEEIKAKMDGNMLSLFDFLESDGKSDMADTLESNQLDRNAIMDILETVFLCGYYNGHLATKHGDYRENAVYRDGVRQFYDE
mgnify:FL=1